MALLCLPWDNQSPTDCIYNTAKVIPKDNFSYNVKDFSDQGYQKSMINYLNYLYTNPLCSSFPPVLADALLPSYTDLKGKGCHTLCGNYFSPPQHLPAAVVTSIFLQSFSMAFCAFFSGWCSFVTPTIYSVSSDSVHLIWMSSHSLLSLLIGMNFPSAVILMHTLSHHTVYSYL